MNPKTIRSLKTLSTAMVLVAVVFAFLIAGIRIFGIQVFGVLTGYNPVAVSVGGATLTEGLFAPRGMRFYEGDEK